MTEEVQGPKDITINKQNVVDALASMAGSVLSGAGDIFDVVRNGLPTIPAIWANRRLGKMNAELVPSEYPMLVKNLADYYNIPHGDARMHLQSWLDKIRNIVGYEGSMLDTISSGGVEYRSLSDMSDGFDALTGRRYKESEVESSGLIEAVYKHNKETKNDKIRFTQAELNLFSRMANPAINSRDGEGINEKILYINGVDLNNPLGLTDKEIKDSKMLRDPFFVHMRYEIQNKDYNDYRRLVDALNQEFENMLDANKVNLIDREFSGYYEFGKRIMSDPNLLPEVKNAKIRILIGSIPELISIEEISPLTDISYATGDNRKADISAMKRVVRLNQERISLLNTIERRNRSVAENDSMDEQIKEEKKRGCRGVLKSTFLSIAEACLAGGSSYTSRLMMENGVNPIVAISAPTAAVVFARLLEYFAKRESNRRMFPINSDGLVDRRKLDDAKVEIRNLIDSGRFMKEFIKESGLRINKEEIDNIGNVLDSMFSHHNKKSNPFVLHRDLMKKAEVSDLEGNILVERINIFSDLIDNPFDIMLKRKKRLQQINISQSDYERIANIAHYDIVFEPYAWDLTSRSDAFDRTRESMADFFNNGGVNGIINYNEYLTNLGSKTLKKSEIFTSDEVEELHFLNDQDDRLIDSLRDLREITQIKRGNKGMGKRALIMYDWNNKDRFWPNIGSLFERNLRRDDALKKKALIALVENDGGEQNYQDLYNYLLRFREYYINKQNSQYLLVREKVDLRILELTIEDLEEAMQKRGYFKSPKNKAA